MRTISLAVIGIGILLSTADARKLLVGPTRTYKTPCEAAGAAQSGDTVEVDTGLYIDQACSWSTSNTVLRGVGKYAHLKAPAVIPNQKAILVVTGSNTTFENLEFSDAAISDALGANGAGIRQEGNNVTIRNCYFHDCQDGILGGGGSSSNVVIESTEFARCGLDPCPSGGCVHNMYIGSIASFTLKACYSHSARIGHLVKSRARENYILYNRLTDESDGTASYELSFPDGGNAYVVGNIIEQCAATDNPAIIDYASESAAYADAKSLYVVNNTVVNHRGSGTFVQFASGTTTVRVVNNLFVGPGNMLSRAADTSHNILTTNPGLVNEAGFDYHITSSSIAVNKGADPGSAGTFSLLPTLQYVHPCASEARPASGALDVGAYEYVASTVIDRSTAWRAPRATGHGVAAKITVDGRIATERRGAGSPRVAVGAAKGQAPSLHVQ